MDHRSNNVYQNLKIGHWNTNGLRERYRELVDFILEYDIDVMLVNETKFLQKNTCKMTGYRCLRKDRGNNIAGGGKLILVKESISCVEIDLKTVNIESLRLKLSNGLIIFSNHLPKLINTADLSRLFQAGNRVIVMGDSNSKHPDWNCTRSNQSGKLLLAYMSKNPFAMIVPDKHTHHPYSLNLPSTIDLALVKNICNCESLEVLNELDSDHSPLILGLRSSQYKDESSEPFYNYKEANWRGFREYIDSKLSVTHRFSNARNIDNAVQN